MVQRDITPTKDRQPKIEKEIQKQENEYALQAAKLFQCFHRFTGDRMSSVCQWVGIKQLKTGKTTPETVEARLRFLSKVWRLSLFRPFDTPSESVTILQNRPEFGFILRLSTTQPGNITCSKMRNGSVVHCRYIVLPDGTMVNHQGEIFKNLQELATRISSSIPKTEQSSEPLHYTVY